MRRTRLLPQFSTRIVMLSAFVDGMKIATSRPNRFRGMGLSNWLRSYNRNREKCA